MKLLKTKKYTILLNILKYSFIGVIAFALILPTLFTNNYMKVVKAEGSPLMTVFNITDTTAQLNGENFPEGSYEIYFVRSDGVRPTHINSNILDDNGNFYNYTITAVVPCTSYTISARRDSATGEVLASVDFETPALLGDTCVFNLPKITSVNPTSGKVGDMITITGENFIVLDKLFFNLTRATPNTNSATEIKVKVPAGATNGIITIITNNGSISSSDSFTVIDNSQGGDEPGGNSNQGTDDDSERIGGITFKKGSLVPDCNTGEIDPETGNYKNPCDFNMVMALINKVINFLLITLATPLFALILVYVGWLYLSDMGSSENITKAKKIFKNVFIGYIIALAAWLIVKTILVSVGFDPKQAFLEI